MPTVPASAAGPSTGGRLRVAHLTSAHLPLDNRIFEKECRSLSAAGFEVVVVAPHSGDETVDGIKVRGVKRPEGRRERFLLTGLRVFRRAVAERADLYHFHDPDLLPWGLLLRLATGRPVVYDVHEDYVTALALVPYIPYGLGSLAGRAYGLVESLASRALTIVIAERYYGRRFKDATLVLNYPRLEVFGGLTELRRSWPRDRIRLLYTGNLSFDRGALRLVAVLDRLEPAELHLIGRCWDDVATAMLSAAARPHCLYFEGGSRGVPFARIAEAYREPWTAGLALFLDTEHSREKELTKLFEYMAAGLPVVCSRFPVWQSLIEGNGCGICVDPEDPEEVAHAVHRLHERPDEAVRMGEAGRRAVLERFNWESEAGKLAALYRRLLGDAR